LPDVQILIGLRTLLVAMIVAVCGRRGLRPAQLTGGAGELVAVTTELAQQRPLSQASAG
jgi:hypothetical protein